MKKILFILSLLFLIAPVFANDIQQIKYKNIDNGSKITTDENLWTTKINRKNKNYFIKRISEGNINFSEFYSPQGEFLFSTATNYEFIHKGSLIGYSNNDLKFYEFSMKKGLLEQRELIFEEVQELFPEYKIVKISDFSETNSYKIKKKNRKIKLILLNDTDKVFYNYWFSTNNSEFDYYLLKGFINIKKRGMIQFSGNSCDTNRKDWYIILIR